MNDKYGYFILSSLSNFHVILISIAELILLLSIALKYNQIIIIDFGLFFSLVYYSLYSKIMNFSPGKLVLTNCPQINCSKVMN